MNCMKRKKEKEKDRRGEINHNDGKKDRKAMGPFSSTHSCIEPTTTKKSDKKRIVTFGSGG